MKVIDEPEPAIAPVKLEETTTEESQSTHEEARSESSEEEGEIISDFESASKERNSEMDILRQSETRCSSKETK